MLQPAVKAQNASPAESVSGGAKAPIEAFDPFAEMEAVDKAFTDEKISEPEAEAPLTAGRTLSSREIRENAKRKKQLDNYRLHILDAMDAAIQLPVSMPVDEIQTKLLTADLEYAKFGSYNAKGQYRLAEQAYLNARDLYSQALVLTSFSTRVEGRAIWLDRGSIVDSGSPAGMKKLMRKLRRAGINVVYVETINAGFPIYPSKLIEKNPLIDGWDPLQAAVEEGHRLGMEVHAWVWCFAVGNMRHNRVAGYEDNYPGPILSGGLMSEALRSSSGALVPARQTEFWLSPASPKARQFLQDVYAEIVANYDVDGLQLDYIRYPFQKSNYQMGYEAVGVQQFARQTGLSPGSLKAWIAWKTLQVNKFVRDTSVRLKAIDPDLKISAAVFPMSRAGRILAIQQDWETWMNKGWVDTLSPMIYTTSRSRLERMIDYVVTSIDKPVFVYPGIAIDRLDAAELIDQVETIRSKGAMGSTLFSSVHLDPAKALALKMGPYKERKSVSPHQDPVKAMDVLVQGYNEKFNRLATKNNLTLLNRREIDGIQKQLAHLKAGLDAIRKSQTVVNTDTDVDQTDDTSPKFSPAQLPSIVPLQTALSQFRQTSEHWLKKERAVHPYRADYFDRQTAQLVRLFDYVKTHPSVMVGDSTGKDSSGSTAMVLQTEM
ncbi:MAG: family 10 glycosylhydrolase [Vampirovibrio sp.]|nr:family 10 glycosylhydrolase [Vampirovibrio sp.]